MQTAVKKFLIWITLTILMLAPFFAADLFMTFPSQHYAMTAQQNGAVFRYEIARPDDGSGPLSLYFLADSQFTQVKINQEILFTRDVLFMPNKFPTKLSVLLEIPRVFLQQDRLLIEIESAGYRISDSSPLEIFLGPRSALEVSHIINFLILMIIPIAVVCVGLYLSLFLFFIWFVGKNKNHYHLISFLLFSSCISEFIFLFSEYVSLPKPLLLVSAVLPASGLFIFWILFWRNSLFPTGPRSRIIISAFIGLITATIALIIASPENNFLVLGVLNLKQLLALKIKLFVWFTLLTIGISAFRANKKDDRPEFYIVFACSMVYLIGSTGLLVRDFLDLSQQNAPLYGQYRGFFFTLYFVINVLVVRDWVRSMNTARDVSDFLAVELQAAKAELARQFEQRIRVEKDNLIRLERESLMRDLHDGVGNRLTSTIALCRMNPETPPQVHDGLQNTLLDLRLMMSAMSETSADLHGLIANFLPQLQRQTRSFGVELECDLLNLPGVVWLRPHQAQHLLRFLLEAVTNAAKHSGAPTVRLEGFAASPRHKGQTHACVAVRDKGRGGAAPRPGSFGLISMEKRASALGGELVITSTTKGTDVLLYLPIAEPETIAAA